MIELLFYVMIAVLLCFSFAAVLSRDLLYASIFLSTGSLAVALLFVMLQAPDIAITKAAVEAGLVTAIFIVAIQKTERMEGR
jgi:uncharacterized MnhB-related membrane protein